MTALVQLRTPKRTVALTIDGEQVSVPEGSTILDATAAMGKSVPTLCYLETLHPGERVPRVRRGGRGLARAGAQLLAQGGSRDGGAHQQRAREAQPKDGAGVPRVERGPLHDAARGRVARRVRLPSGALRAAGARGRRTARATRCTPAITTRPIPRSRRPCASRSRSTTSSTCAITASASCATSAWRRAAPISRTPSRSPSRVADSTRASPPSSPRRCRARRACTAAIASPCAPRAR